MRYQHLTSLAVIILLAVNGCAANKLKNTQKLEAEARKLAQAATISPEQAFQEAKDAMQQAEQEELELYAPLHMKEAKLSLAEAQKLASSKTNNAKLLEFSFKVKQLVLDGIKNKTQAQTTLSRSIDHLMILKDIGSPEYFRDEYRSRREDLVDLISMIESGEIKEAIKDEPKLLAKMSALEIKTVYAKYISPAEEILKKAKNEKADELAASTYKKAETEIQNARTFINANYKNRKAVEDTGKSAIRAANHAFYIAKEAAELKGMKAELAEQRVLYIESLFEKITQGMNIESGIGNSFHEQANLIVKQAEDLSSQIRKLNSKQQLSEETRQSAKEQLRAAETERDFLKIQLKQAREALTAATAQLYSGDHALQPAATTAAETADKADASTPIETSQPVSEKTENTPGQETTTPASEQQKELPEPESTREPAAPTAASEIKQETPIQAVAVESEQSDVTPAPVTNPQTAETAAVETNADTVNNDAQQAPAEPVTEAPPEAAIKTMETTEESATENKADTSEPASTTDTAPAEQPAPTASTSETAVPRQD